MSVVSLRVDSDADVLVVGAGPAGAAAAYWLQRAGRQVTLVDRAEFPRDKVCGDGLPPRAVLQVQHMGLGEFLSRYQRHSGLSLTPLGTTPYTLAWPDIGDFPRFSVAIPRFELDEALVEAAVAQGVVLRTGLRAVDVVRRPGDDAVASVEFVGKSGLRETISCRDLVVADGAGSPLGAKLGRTWQRECIYGVAGRSYVAASGCSSDYLRVRMSVRQSPGGRPVFGYAWAFPLGDGRVNFGYGSLIVDGQKPTISTRTLNQDALAESRDMWGLDGPMTHYGAAPLAVGGAVTTVAGTNWLCAGDAACGTSPLTGEGIDFALESGRSAADAVVEGGPYTRLWPHALRARYGVGLSGARSLVTTIVKHAGVAGWLLPKAMNEGWVGRTTLRTSTNMVSDTDTDSAARLYRLVGGTAHRFGPTIFGE